MVVDDAVPGPPGVYKAQAKTDAIDTMEDAEGLGHVHACRETKRYAEATVRILLRV